jgi:hypothetical protein
MKLWLKGIAAGVVVIGTLIGLFSGEWELLEYAHTHHIEWLVDRLGIAILVAFLVMITAKAYVDTHSETDKPQEPSTPEPKGE